MEFFKFLKICLLTLSLSFSSVLPQVSFAQQPTAQAEEEEQEDSIIDEEVTLKERGDAPGDWDWGHINGLLMGFIGYNMMTTCTKKTMDMYVAIAGSIAYIYGEYRLLDEYESLTDEQTVEYQRDRDNFGQIVDNGQKEALEELKENYENIYDALEKKREAQQTAKSLMEGAAAIALAAGVIETASRAFCKSAAVSYIASTLGTGSAQCSSAIGIMAWCEGNVQVPKNSAAESTQVQYNAAAITPCPGCGFAAKMMTQNQAVCSPLFLLSDTSETFLHELLTMAGIEDEQRYTSTQNTNKTSYTPTLETILSGVSNLVFPQAQAVSFGDAFRRIFAGPGLGAIVAYGAATYMGIELFVGGAYRRTFVWSTLAYGFNQGLEQTESDLDTVRGNINKINEVLQYMDEADSEGNLALDSGPESRQYSAAGSNNRTYGADGDSTTSFGSEEGEGFCPEDDQGNCAQFAEETQGVNVEGFEQGDPFMDFYENAIEAGQNIQTGNTTEGKNFGTDYDFEKGSAAIRNRANRMLDELDKEDRDRVKEYLDSGANEFEKTLASKAREALKEHGTTPSALMASLGATNAPEREDESEKSEEVSEYSSEESSVVDGGEPTTASRKGPEFEMSDWGEDEDFDMSSDDARSPSDIAGLKEGEEFEMNDISNRKETSIFKVISNRYLRSGYERLSNKDKDTE